MKKIISLLSFIALSILFTIPTQANQKSFIATNIRDVTLEHIDFYAILRNTTSNTNSELKIVSATVVATDQSHVIHTSIQSLGNNLYRATYNTPLKAKDYKVYFNNQFEMWTSLKSSTIYTVTNNRLTINKPENTFIATAIENINHQQVTFFAALRGIETGKNIPLNDIRADLIATDNSHRVQTNITPLGNNRYTATYTTPLQNKSYKVYFKTNNSEFEMWTALNTSKNYIVQNNRLTLTNNEKTFTATNIKNVNTSYIDFYASERGVTSNINHPVQNISVSLIATDQSHIINTTMQKLGTYDYRAILQSPLQNKQYKIYFNHQNEMWTSLTSSKNYIVRNNRLTITPNQEKTFIATNIQSVTPEYFTFYAANRGVVSNQNSVLDNVGAKLISIDNTHIVTTNIEYLGNFIYKAIFTQPLQSKQYKFYITNNNTTIEMWTNLTSSYKTKVTNNRAILNNQSFKVFLDPGHGGKDSGAYYYGVKESDLNLDIYQRLKPLLEKEGITVFESRTTDIYVDYKTERSKMANELKSDIFISIHFNASGKGEGRGPSGIETYYYKFDPEYPPKINPYLHDNPERIRLSKKLAETIHNHVVKDSNQIDRGVRTDTFAVTRESFMPAILIELGYMDNPQDRLIITKESYRQILAEAIVKGIKQYIQEQ